MSTYRERRAARAERLAEWSAKHERKADQSFTAAHQVIAGIPPGQPILVGHHSERHHRRDLARHDSKMRKAFEHQGKAQDQARRADTIEAQLEASIYDDDPDALERLTEKLEALEARRARYKAVSAAIRKHGYPALHVESVHWDPMKYERALLTPPLTDAEITDLQTLDRITPYHNVTTRGYPPYYSSNLTNLIGRTRDRITRLQGAPASAPREGATARDRAGLVITAGKTTPTRPGKQPRDVWTVTGNLGPHRALLQDLGGSWYRSAFSFWEDPTDAIEIACAERENA